MLKVFGHLGPDTDSICSAIAYAWFLDRQGRPATPYRQGEPNREAAFVLAHFGQPLPELLGNPLPEDEIVIVDTNNPDELNEATKAARLVEVVDHHKLTGGLATPEPILFTLRPLACTATVIWQLMQEAGVTPEKKVAGLMLAAILSDTLKFTSPTTTEIDREAATKLAELAGENVDALAEGMFAAKSDLTGLSPRDLLLSDSKIYELGGKKLRVCSLETTKPENALKMAEELRAAMAEMKKADGLDGVLFFIVDILQSKAQLLASADFENETAEKAFGKGFEDGVMELPGVVSRKKQIIPPLEKALS